MQTAFLTSENSFLNTFSQVNRVFVLLGELRKERYLKMMT